RAARRPARPAPHHRPAARGRRRRRRQPAERPAAVPPRRRRRRPPGRLRGRPARQAPAARPRRRPAGPAWPARPGVLAGLIATSPLGVPARPRESTCGARRWVRTTGAELILAGAPVDTADAARRCPGGVPPAGLLDQLVRDRPAWLESRDGHSGWANAAALARACIGPASPDPPRGRLERDARGAPTGVLHEEAMRLVERVVPRPGP